MNYILTSILERLKHNELFQRNKHKKVLKLKDMDHALFYDLYKLYLIKNFEEKSLNVKNNIKKNSKRNFLHLLQFSCYLIGLIPFNVCFSILLSSFLYKIPLSFYSGFSCVAFIIFYCAFLCFIWKYPVEKVHKYYMFENNSLYDECEKITECILSDLENISDEMYIEEKDFLKRYIVKNADSYLVYSSFKKKVYAFFTHYIKKYVIKKSELDIKLEEKLINKEYNIVKNHSEPLDTNILS